MGYRRLGLAIAAALGLLVLSLPEPASAVGVLPLRGTPSASAGLPLSVHFRKSQSFYCYPKNYWWFYRPYTTAFDEHARCMPYFHYLGPGERGPRPNRYIK
jgi:hypothetical protein